MASCLQLNMENPYIACIIRKQRNLKKKYETIMKTEAKFAAKKETITPEQLVLLATKEDVEKTIADLQGIRTALEEIAKVFLINFIILFLSPPGSP